MKGMLKTPRLKYHMMTIGIKKYFSNRASFEHKCLNNIKKINQHAVKCDEQQKIKDILEDAMVYTPE